MAVRMTQGILLLCTGLPIDFLTRSPSSGKGVGELCLLLCLDMTDSFAIVLRICLSADTKREAHRGTMASGYRYHYRCPQCGTVLHLRMRVTVRQRRCPHCGVAVTCDEIDRQTIDESLPPLLGTLIGVVPGMFLGLYVWNSSRNLLFAVLALFLPALLLTVAISWLLSSMRD